TVSRSGHAVLGREHRAVGTGRGRDSTGRRYGGPSASVAAGQPHAFTPLWMVNACRRRITLPKSLRSRAGNSVGVGVVRLIGVGGCPRAGWEKRANHGTAAGCALGFDPARVRLDEVAHDGEPESGAARVARPAGIHSIKALEDAGQVLGRDADARIADAQP